MPYYAVRRGRNPGIYNDWDSCRDQVNQFSQARYKKFSTREEAEAFVAGEDNYSGGGSNSCKRNYGGSSKYSGSGYSGSSSYRSINYGGYYSQPKRFKSTDSSSDSSDSSDGPVSVYTDGACTDNGRDGARAGIGVYWGPNHHRNVSQRLPGRQTNNRAEIHAARHAIEQAKSEGIRDLKIHTDSQFLINGMTKWIHGWKRNGWKLSTGQPVINREDFEALDKASKGINLQWEHVRGHQGVHGNEEADKLANEGANKPHM